MYTDGRLVRSERTGTLCSEPSLQKPILQSSGWADCRPAGLQTAGDACPAAKNQQGSCLSAFPLIEGGTASSSYATSQAISNSHSVRTSTCHRTTQNYYAMGVSPHALPVAFGRSSRAPHSVQLPSYTATEGGGCGSCSRASASTLAVTPVPHEATTGLLRSTAAP